MGLSISSKNIYRFFHDVDFTKYPRIFRYLKTKSYPLTSMFIVKTDFANFYLDDMVKTTNVDEYCLDDLREDDTVMDIGACIGGFSLKICNRVKRVYAVEPIFANRLRNNIKLNKAANVEVVECGLGDGCFADADWAGYSKNISTLTLSELIQYKTQNKTHIDFLKLDCEGAEYYIKPEELKGIRRIEAELHQTKEHTHQDFLSVLKEAGFTYCCEQSSDDRLMYVHSYRS